MFHVVGSFWKELVPTFFSLLICCFNFSFGTSNAKEQQNIRTFILDMYAKDAFSHHSSCYLYFIM
jgi:hypothetical protein